MTHATPHLPNELLALIFGHFCLHCQDAYNDYWDQRPLQSLTSLEDSEDPRVKPGYSIDRQTLCSLSLSCRQFRDVAQSILHHEFVLGYGDIWFSDAYQWEDRLAPFIRTLARRPDLARLVKAIYISHHILSTSSNKEQSRRNILLEAAGALCIDLPAAWKKRVEIRDSICLSEKCDWPDVYPVFSEFYLDDHPRLTEKQQRQLRRAMTEKSTPGRRWMNAELAAMLLAHTPNIEIISIQSSPGWPTCGIAKSSLSVLGVTHLPVKRLDLGIQAGPIINICDNLETLNYHGYIDNLGDFQIEMPCLKTLRITCGFLSAAQLSKVLEGCTGSLITFEYAAGHERWQNDDRLPTSIFQLPDAIESLRRHKSTLQTLHLDVSARCGDIRRAKRGINMRDFTALKHIWISTILLFPIVLIPGSKTPADAEIFVEFLPRSIVSLEIYRDPRCSTTDAVHRLAAVKRGKFPFLKKVVYSAGDIRNLGQVFEVEGVSFGTKLHRLSLVKPYLLGPNEDSRLEFPDGDSDEELPQGEEYRGQGWVQTLLRSFWG